MSAKAFFDKQPMEKYKVVQVLDITQPLYKHKERSAPAVLKAVVKSESEVRIIYIETEWLSVGKGSVFVAEKSLQVVRLSQVEIEKQTVYTVDKNMVMNLLETKKKKQAKTWWSFSETCKRKGLIKDERLSFHAHYLCIRNTSSS